MTFGTTVLSKRPPPFSTISQLANQADIKYGIVKGGITEVGQGRAQRPGEIHRQRGRGERGERGGGRGRKGGDEREERREREALLCLTLLTKRLMKSLIIYFLQICTYQIQITFFFVNRASSGSPPTRRTGRCGSTWSLIQMSSKPTWRTASRKSESRTVNMVSSSKGARLTTGSTSTHVIWPNSGTSTLETTMDLQ